MAHDSQSLTIEPGAWGPDAAAWLSQALGHSTIEDLKGQLEQGAALFYIRHEGATVGAFLLRVDHTEKGAEGVIVAGAAALDGVDMMAACMPAIEARFKGCTSLRYHTNSPAVMRKLARFGYVPREIIAVKEINHGQ